MIIKPLTLLCFLYCLAIVNAFAKNAQSVVIPVSENVAGKAQHEYANIWWQWASTMSDETSPIRDNDGKYCHINQSGDVWFLAGGYGTSKIKRHCVIPQGKHIFFPIINMAYWPVNGVSKTCEEVKEESALNNNELYFVYAELDGDSVPNMRGNRIKSEDCFDLHGLLVKQKPVEKVYPAATDGYWLMLKPLAKGMHSLKFNAQYQHDSALHGKVMQDIEYTIEVK